MGGNHAGIAFLVALTVTTAGCAGVLLGTETLGFAAADATASAAALEETGYREARDVSINRTQTFTIAGQERTAEISNELHSYNRTGRLGTRSGVELGRVTVLSTPAIEVAGQTFNPVGRLSIRDLAGRFSVSGNGSTGLEFVGNRSVLALGDRRTVSEFETTTGSGTGGVAQSIHVSTFRHGSDFIVVVATHPRAVEGERGRVDTLVRSLRHRTGD